MADAAIACRSEIDLAGVGLGIGCELAQRLGGHLVVHQQRQRLHGSAGNGGEVLERVVGQLAVQRWVDDHHAGIGQHQRVAIRRRAHDILRAHRATGARLVIHHHRLAQHGLQLVRQQTGMLIQRAACRKAHHQTNRLAGEGIRRLRARRHQQTCARQQARQNVHGDFFHQCLLDFCVCALRLIRLHRMSPPERTVAPIPAVQHLHLRHGGHKKRFSQRSVFGMEAELAQRLGCQASALFCCSATCAMVSLLAASSRRLAASPPSSMAARLYQK